MAKVLCSVCHDSFDDPDGQNVCSNCRVQVQKKKETIAQAAASNPLGIVRPEKFEVKTTVLTMTLGGDGKESYAGKGTLIVDGEGMHLKVKSLLFPEQEIFISWDRVRKLKNRLFDKKQFNADFGDGTNLVLKVTIKQGDSRWLSGIFDKLPDEAQGEICPACGGVAIQDKCKKCGKSVSWEQRKSGLWMTLGGGAVFAVGLGITALSHSQTQAGEEFTVATGIIVIGAGIFCIGLCKMIFGKLELG